MRILFLNYEFPPLGGGGAKQARYLARELAQQHQLYFLTAGFENFGIGQNDGYCLHLLKTGRKTISRASYRDMFCYLFKAWLTLPQVVKKFNPNVTLVFFTIPTGPLTYHPALHRIPFVISIRGSDVPGHNTGRFTVFSRLLTPIVKNIWSRSRAVICNSQGLKEEVSGFGLRRQIEIIPNGIDLDKFQPVKKRPSAGLHLLYVGRLIPLKRIDKIIETLPDLQRLTKEEVTLTIVGQGREKQKLVELAAKIGMANQVIFRGGVTYDRIERIYQGADVYVQLSTKEGMSNSVVEALACGLPVVTTPVGGVAELQNTQAVVIVNDLAELAAAILKARKLEPQRDFLKQLSFGHMAEHYQRVMKKACAE